MLAPALSLLVLMGGETRPPTLRDILGDDALTPAPGTLCPVDDCDTGCFDTSVADVAVLGEPNLCAPWPDGARVRVTLHISTLDTRVVVRVDETPIGAVLSYAVAIAGTAVATGLTFVDAESFAALATQFGTLDWAHNVTSPPIADGESFFTEFLENDIYVAVGASNPDSAPYIRANNQFLELARSTISSDCAAGNIGACIGSLFLEPRFQTQISLDYMTRGLRAACARGDRRACAVFDDSDLKRRLSRRLAYASPTPDASLLAGLLSVVMSERMKISGPQTNE